VNCAEAVWTNAKIDIIAQSLLTSEQFKIKTKNSNRKDPIAVIDVIAHDAKTDEAVLVMNEPQAWDGSDDQLHTLQERFNTYASFLLDGEMAEAHPELVGKKARIEVHCAQMPDTRTLELLGMIHDQLAFQAIKMEVVVAQSGACGPSCECSGN
jgi:hypothetical protein